MGHNALDRDRIHYYNNAWAYLPVAQRGGWGIGEKKFLGLRLPTTVSFMERIFFSKFKSSCLE